MNGRSKRCGGSTSSTRRYSDVSDFTVLSLDELERIPVSGADVTWRPIRRRLEITAFGINAYTGDPGEHVVEKHTEERLRHEELYVVLSGRARFELDGQTIDAPAGTLVFVSKPEVERHAVAEEAGTTVLAIGGKPGSHETSAWEYFFAAYAYADRGEFEQALAELREGIAEHPDRAPLYYHLACIETRAGRLEDAAGHLDRAVELDPSLRKWADEDDDLAAVRNRQEA
jgi:tetratricopeptide (TPR) repeat protein